jgi:hypothetical protein
LSNNAESQALLGVPAELPKVLRIWTTGEVDVLRFFPIARHLRHDFWRSNGSSSALPLNIDEQHDPLFAPDLKYDVPASQMLQLENITAFSNGWLYHGHTLLKDSFVQGSQIGVMRRLKGLGRRYLLPVKSLQRIPAGVWITDNWSGNYFHWLTDAIPRLHLAKEQGQNLHLILPSSLETTPFIE